MMTDPDWTPAATTDLPAPHPPAPDPPVEPAADEDNGPLTPLDPRIVRVWRLGSAISTVIMTGLVLGALALLGWSLGWALPVLLLGVAEGVYVPRARYRHFGYHVGEVDVRVARGALWRTLSVVLHSRIQHVDTRQGPLARMFGLASVVVFTAGSVGAMVEIPGLAAADAEALRDRLARLSGSEDAV